jgi:hypothetical protein
MSQSVFSQHSPLVSQQDQSLVCSSVQFIDKAEEASSETAVR